MFAFFSPLLAPFCSFVSRLFACWTGQIPTTHDSILMPVKRRNILKTTFRVYHIVCQKKQMTNLLDFFFSVLIFSSLVYSFVRYIFNSSPVCTRAILEFFATTKEIWWMPFLHWTSDALLHPKTSTKFSEIFSPLFDCVAFFGCFSCAFSFRSAFCLCTLIFVLYSNSNWCRRTSNGKSGNAETEEKQWKCRERETKKHTFYALMDSFSS